MSTIHRRIVGPEDVAFHDGPGDWRKLSTPPAIAAVLARHEASRVRAIDVTDRLALAVMSEIRVSPTPTITEQRIEEIEDELADIARRIADAIVGHKAARSVILAAPLLPGEDEPARWRRVSRLMVAQCDLTSAAVQEQGARIWTLRDEVATALPELFTPPPPIAPGDLPAFPSV